MIYCLLLERRNVEAYTMWEKEHVKYELKCGGIYHVGKGAC